MEEIKTKYIKKGYSEIEQPIIIDQTAQTRTVLKCALTPKGVRGEIWRQKKREDGQFSDQNEIDFRKEDKNYGVKIEIPSDGLRILAKELYNIFIVRKEKGVEFGENSYIVTDKNKTSAIRSLIEEGYSEEFINKLKEIKPDQVENISKLEIIEKRAKDLKEFKEQIENNDRESYWQSFFEKRKWIFGYGLNYKILKQLETQPYYGGETMDGRGAQIGDYITHTEGLNKYTVLVEIKTPKTKMLKGNQPNRSGAWSLSKGLTDAITQLQANIDTWNTQGSKKPDNIDLLHNQSIYTITPKGILVIGTQGELDNHDKRRTFERLRQSINGIEIITFDELMERAKFILSEDNDNQDR